MSNIKQACVMSKALTEDAGSCTACDTALSAHACRDAHERIVLMVGAGTAVSSAQLAQAAPNRHGLCCMQALCRQPQPGAVACAASDLLLQLLGARGLGLLPLALQPHRRLHLRHAPPLVPLLLRQALLRSKKSLTLTRLCSHREGRSH
jgi:hypothetical protein